MNPQKIYKISKKQIFIITFQTHKNIFKIRLRP